MSRLRVSFALVVPVAMLLVLVSPALAANRSVSIREANERYSFRPGTITINAGDSVTWTNSSDAPHTVTSDSGSELASSELDEDQTFSHTFDSTGTFAYHCTIHDYMTGTVKVLAAGAPLPATDTEPSIPTGLFGALLAMGGIAGLVLGFRRYAVRRA